MTKKEFLPIFSDLELLCNTFGKNATAQAKRRAEILFEELKVYTAPVVERAVKYLFRHEANPVFPTPARLIECISMSHVPVEKDLTDGRTPMTPEQLVEWRADLRAATALSRAGRKAS